MHYVAAGLAVLVLAAIATSPADASGKRRKDSANTIYCNSGKHVDNSMKCKEFGGKN